MKYEISAQELEEKVRNLISTYQSNLGIELSMPLIYPDGDVVSVVVSPSKEGFLVHDAGYGSMYLAKEGLTLRKPVRTKLSNIAAKYGCYFVDGRMERVVSTKDELPGIVAIVANASRSIGDQALEIRHRVENEFRALVTEKLRSIVGARVKVEEEVQGASSKKYKIDNLVLDKNLTRPVAFVEALYARSMIANRYTEFADLRAAHQDVQNDAVLDDAETWKDEDMNLLSQVANSVVRASEAEPLYKRLAA